MSTIQIPTPQVTEWEFSSNDNFLEAFQAAFHSGDIQRQLDEIETLEAMECVVF